MLIQVSFHSVGKPQSCWVSAEVLAGKTAGCISEHKQDGTPIMYQVPCCRDPQRRMLNVKARAEAAHQAIWRQLCLA